MDAEKWGNAFPSERRLRSWVKDFRRDEETARRSIGSLYEACSRAACGLCERWLGPDDAVGDAVHDVFANLWAKREGLEIHGTVEGYLHKSLTNACLRRTNRESRVASFDEAGILADWPSRRSVRQADEHVLSGEVEAAMSRLSTGRRQAVELTLQGLRSSSRPKPLTCGMSSRSRPIRSGILPRARHDDAISS
ncbi:MAG TPA: sigma factor [Longimicrobiales bacterium]|nr:sigma factor [Longimicrobiales bacterium]